MIRNLCYRFVEFNSRPRGHLKRNAYSHHKGCTIVMSIVHSEPFSFARYAVHLQRARLLQIVNGVTCRLVSLGSGSNKPCRDLRIITLPTILLFAFHGRKLGTSVLAPIVQRMFFTVFTYGHYNVKQNSV